MDSGQHFQQTTFVMNGGFTPKNLPVPAVISQGQLNLASRVPEMYGYNPSSLDRSSRPKKSKLSPSMKLSREEGAWRLNAIGSMEPSHSGSSVNQERKHHSASPGAAARYERPAPQGLYPFSHQHPQYHGPDNGMFHHSQMERSYHQAPLASSFRDIMPRPLPALVPVPATVTKPKPRKSQQLEGFPEMTHHMWAMPPPISELPSHQGGQKKQPHVPSKQVVMKATKKTKKSSAKTVAVKKINSRWKAVTDAHQTRLVDLIRLKPGEETEFEEELANNANRSEDDSRTKRKLQAGNKRSGEKQYQRAISLRSANLKPSSRGGPSTSQESDAEGSPAGQHRVRVIAKVRVSAAPEERYRKPLAGNPDLEIFEMYYGAKKRNQAILKRTKPLTTMRRPERSKLSTMLAQKTRPDIPAPPSVSHPAAEWGHAAFAPTGKSLNKSPRIQLEHSPFRGELSSLPSLSSTPSHPDSEFHFSDADADESRRKILVQLQKLNDKRARLEAQLTKIQRNQNPPGAPVQQNLVHSSAFRPTISYGIPQPTQLHQRHPETLLRSVLKFPPTPHRDYLKEQWKVIALKYVPLAHRLRQNRREEAANSRSKLNAACLRDHAEKRIESERLAYEYTQRAKFMVRDMFARWKVIDKEERKYKRQMEKDAVEQKRIDLEMQEARRQQRKLNFLITQTELYAHFMGKKISGSGDQESAADQNILQRLNAETAEVKTEEGELLDTSEKLVGDQAKTDALRNVEEAFEINKKRVLEFDKNAGVVKGDFGTAKFDLNDDNKLLCEPTMFQGTLKAYQRKGISWLASLFSNGINGILADEMGLGKTVQSIAFLSHVAEEHGIWGPFLIVAPASTLHNWQQEFHRFLPKFKAVPYWGTCEERKILRQFWKADLMHTEQASFHVVITSYQLIVQDAPYLKKINWQYMILDEAQAIKSSASIRWKLLLDFPCRNRLLLTGTPIQNSMAELWALLHFIMPSLFDSHMEFNEWFSRDIENHAENKSQIDEKHLSRLHMILKPFMMRRIKRDVEEELTDKIEIMMNCPLTKRQQSLYVALKHKISIEDLLYSSTTTSTSSDATSSLLNLVMQFRKVCNHPELFERRDVRSPAWTPALEVDIPKLVYKEASVKNVQCTTRYLVDKFFLLSSPWNVEAAQLDKRKSDGPLESMLSFCAFHPVQEVDVKRIFNRGLSHMLRVKMGLKRKREISYHNQLWGSGSNGRNLLMLEPTFATSEEALASTLQKFVLVDPDTRRYSFGSCKIHYVVEVSDQKQKVPEDHESESFTAVSESADEPEVEEPRQPRLVEHYPLWLPNFFSCFLPKALSRSPQLYVRDRDAESERLLLILRNCQLEYRQMLWLGSPDLAEKMKLSYQYLHPIKIGGIFGTHPDHGWSPMEIPDKQHLIVDSGKLRVLDSLLHRLKDEGHRVLIYCLMTKMMDILEEFMVHKRYPYIRLDGSSKIADRRDMVNDFQSREDIFVFLLSTRAGGLGINLTAADTVIFYDSDWNPTVDQQAMDRAHRLGQTKQVTVYRLICRNTVEERILERAQEKSEIQRMVISGGDYRPDTLKPTEVVSLLLDDDEIRLRLRQREVESKPRDDPAKKGTTKTRRPPAKREHSSSGKAAPRKALKVEDKASASAGPSARSRPAATPADKVIPDENATESVQISGSLPLPELSNKPKAKPKKKAAPVKNIIVKPEISHVEPTEVANTTTPLPAASDLSETVATQPSAEKKQKAVKTKATNSKPIVTVEPEKVAVTGPDSAKRKKSKPTVPLKAEKPTTVHSPDVQINGIVVDQKTLAATEEVKTTNETQPGKRKAASSKPPKANNTSVASSPKSSAKSSKAGVV